MLHQKNYNLSASTDKLATLSPYKGSSFMRKMSADAKKTLMAKKPASEQGN